MLVKCALIGVEVLNLYVLYVVVHISRSSTCMQFGKTELRSVRNNSINNHALLITNSKPVLPNPHAP